MYSDDEIGIDSGNVSSEEDDNYDFMEVDAAIQRSSSNNQNDPLEYPYEVLTTEEIVQHMLDCIKEVTNVVEVRSIIVHSLTDLLKIIVYCYSPLRDFNDLEVREQKKLIGKSKQERKTNYLVRSEKFSSIFINLIFLFKA